MELSPFWFGVYKLAKYAVYPLTWVFVLAGLLAVLVAAPITPRRLRWIRVLAVSTVLLVLVLGNPVVARLLTAQLEARHPPFDRSTSRKFDAIVVFGGGALAKGTLRPSNELAGLSMKRTLCGADLYVHGFAPRMLLSGGEAAVFGHGPKEAEEMKRLALRLGVPEPAIVVEDRSRTTYENAVETKRLLGNASILLVTSAMHMPRALSLARKQGLDATPAPCDYTATNVPSQAWVGNPLDLIPEVTALSRSTEALAELAGTLVYWVTGKL